MADDELGVSRRALLAGGTGAVVGGAAGVLYFGDVMGGGDADGGSEQVTAQDPDGDGESTLPELRYLIESLEQEEHTVTVTSFTYTNDVIELAYESNAGAQSGYQRWHTHVGELGHVVWSYARYIADDGPKLDWPPESSEDEGTASRPTAISGTAEDGTGEVTGVRMTASIENPYSVESEESETPEQPDSYAIEREWAVNWIVGAWPWDRLINTVANTRVATATPE